MSLKDRLAAETIRPTFAAWLLGLSPEDQQALEQAAHPQSGFSNAQLMRIISAEGGTVSKETIAKYRADVAR